MRKFIPLRKQLAIMIRFLALGNSFVSWSYLLKISNQSISNIVHEVCDDLIKEFDDEIQVRFNL